jgi:integrase
LWIEAGEQKGLERTTLDTYRQHLTLHINPYLGAVKLSQLSAPMVREFEDRLTRGDMTGGSEPQPRSQVMVRKVRVSLSSLLSDAQELALVARNVVRDLRKGRRRGAERQAERRQKGKLKVGVAAKRSGPWYGLLRAAGGHCS